MTAGVAQRIKRAYTTMREHEAMAQINDQLDEIDASAVNVDNAPLTLPPRVPGRLKGKIWIAPDFDAPDPEIEALFHGTDS